jgi:1-acyl-sn-glycerol-3-phosphate acyltransferase
LARIVLSPLCVVLFRLRARGRRRVPPEGPVLLAPNHFSAWDHFFCGIYLRRRVRFMAKSQLFSNPLLTAILVHGGAFPVRRGHRDEEAMATARSILERDGTIVVYPEGGRSRDGKLGRARPGVGRLALETGAPVVPVAIHGSLGIRRHRLPKVVVEYGAPIAFARVERPSREEQQAAADEVFAAVRELYARLDGSGHAGNY